MIFLELEVTSLSMKASWLFKYKKARTTRGNEVVISELSSSACPVSILKRYLDKFCISLNSRDLIFKPISKEKGFCKIVSQTNLSATAVFGMDSDRT